jgi:hypothetical protein
MISDGCTDTNRKVLIEGVGEHLLPTDQTLGLCWLGPTVTAPGTRNGHIDLFCQLTPGRASVTQLHDLLCRCRVRRSAATHGDPGTTQLIADRGRREAQLCSDLAQGPALGVQIGRTVNVHGATVMGARHAGDAHAMSAAQRTGGQVKVLAKIGRGDEQDAATIRLRLALVAAGWIPTQWALSGQSESGRHQPRGGWHGW